MNLETFFEKFNLFADAPDAVAKMRKLIFAYATSGKLLEQNPEEQPATSLLEIAETQRKDLEKSKQIGKQKRLPAIPKEEEPFSLPEGWCWSRLGTTGVIFNGNSINASEKERKYMGAEGRPYIATKDAGYGLEPLAYENGVCIPESESKFKIAHRSSVLICSEGGSAGRKCGFTDRDICFGNKLFCNEPLAEIHAKYILFWYLSPTFLELFDEVKTGIIGGVSVVKFIALPIPLPPLAEQKRIVAKVDELMALCDRLDAQQKEREEKHAALARASLARFADAPTPTNLPFLFHPSYTISPADLRKSILTLAIQGKLVPQDPDDEPVEATAEGESLFDIPSSWRWHPLGALGLCRTGKTPPTNDPSNYGEGFPFIGPGQITPSGKFIASEKMITKKGLENSTEAAASDILMVCIGGSIGKAAICREVIGFNQQINSIRLNRDLPEFIFLAVTADYFQEQVLAKASGSATPIINKGKWSSISVPIPPLAEQYRIVEKVDQLMALVNELETQLAASRTAAANLLSALVAELTGTPANRTVSAQPTKGTGRRGRPPKS